MNLWANIELGVKLEGKAHPQTCDVYTLATADEKKAAGALCL